MTLVSTRSHLTNHRKSSSWGKRLVSFSLHWMQVNKPIPDVYDHTVLEVLQHMVWPQGRGVFWVRKCWWEGVRPRWAPGLSRSQCDAGGAVISQSSLENFVTTVIYIWLQFFLWSYSCHQGIITMLLNYSYSKSSKKMDHTVAVSLWPVMLTWWFTQTNSTA